MRAVGVRAIKQVLKECVKTGGRFCKIGIPIVVAGGDYPNQTQHIEDAQEGRGENWGERRITAILQYQNSKINRDSWPPYTFPNGFSIRLGTPYGLPSCTNIDKTKAIQKFGGEVQCDEYPFSASKEGGYGNYKQFRVSARFIPKTENNGFGKIIKLATSKMKKNDEYLVFPASYSPYSFFIPKP